MISINVGNDTRRVINPVLVAEALAEPEYVAKPDDAWVVKICYASGRESSFLMDKDNALNLVDEILAYDAPRGSSSGS